MCKKRCRKILNVFLCVIWIVAIFSVTVMADDAITENAEAYVMRAGSYCWVESGIDFSSLIANVGVQYRLSALFCSAYDDSIYSRFTIVLSEGRIAYVTENELGAFPHFVYEGSSGWLDDSYRSVVLLEDVVFENYDDYIWFTTYLKDIWEFSDVLDTFSVVSDVVADFSKIITENVLLLLFAIGLPVCSFGAGLFIRLKERT